MEAFMSAALASPRHRSGQRGFTVVEIAVALTVLAAGSSVLWYGLRASAKLDKLNRLHHAAVLAARSDLESLRGRPKENIHDTSYQAAGSGGDSLLVVRRVMDSARIVNTMDEIVLDDKLSPKELRKPLEVRVSVFRLVPSEDGSFRDASAFPDPDSEDAFGPEAGAGKADRPGPLTSLILKLPEYKWY
jgi:prepilin-type N-terminal cleavage/methylation domain-containing protein